MDPIDEFITPPNGGAHEKSEVRTGLPLSYVGEKLGMAVIFTHAAQRALGSDGSTARPVGFEPGASAYAAFRSATTAFLALYSMLGLIEDQGKLKGLLKLNPEEFRTWVEMVQREGSIGG